VGVGLDTRERVHTLYCAVSYFQKIRGRSKTPQPTTRTKKSKNILVETGHDAHYARSVRPKSRVTSYAEKYILTENASTNGTNRELGLRARR
jgi:hypothetical protein